MDRPEVNVGNSVDVAIVGAGIGGLALAYYLHRAGNSVVVLEASERPGGWIRTERRDGFLLEFGPNSLLRRPVLDTLVDELCLGGRLTPAYSSARERFIVRGTDESDPLLALVKVPSGPMSALLTPMLSFRAKMNLLRGPWVPKTGSDDESVHEFIARRLGLEVAENVVAPALSGVYAADVRTLSARSALGKLWEFEQDHGSLIGAGASLIFKKNKRPPAGKRTRARGGSRIVSFQNGLSELPEALLSALPPGAFRSHATVTGLEGNAERVRVHVSRRHASAVESENIDARRVVLTVEGESSAHLLEPLDSALAHTVRKIPYAPVGVLHLAVRAHGAPSSIRGFGALLQPRLRYGLLGVLFSSCIFPGRAPGGYHLLTCFSGGAHQPELADVTDKRVRDRIVGEVQKVVGLSTKPEVIAETYHPRAIPNYPLRHYRTQDHVAQFHVQHPRVRILANWAKGIGVVDRLLQAEILAQEAIA